MCSLSQQFLEKKYFGNYLCLLIHDTSSALFQAILFQFTENNLSLPSNLFPSNAFSEYFPQYFTNIIVVYQDSQQFIVITEYLEAPDTR